MVVERKLSFDHRYSRPQKQSGKSPPRTDDFFDEYLGIRARYFIYGFFLDISINSLDNVGKRGAY